MARKKVAVIDYQNGGKTLNAPVAGDNLDKFLNMMDDPDDWYPPALNMPNRVHV